MQETLTNITQVIPLNADRTTRQYLAEVITTIKQGKKKTFASVGMEFDLIYYGKGEEGTLQYRVEVLKRFLLSERYNIIKNLTKAQQIAMKVAAINDVIELRIDQHYKLIKVVNTDDIREKWQRVKSELLNDFPDLKEMTEDFDWQLQEENIQRLFLEDNFYNFFFSNIHNQDFEGKKPLECSKYMPNAIGNITIPIIEQKRIGKQNFLFSEVTIETKAIIDTEHKRFPKTTLDLFLDQLMTAPGNQHPLNFEYLGSYKVRPQEGLVTEGALNYVFKVKDLYQKTTTINFNLLGYE